MSLDGIDLARQTQIDEILGRHKPGDTIAIVFVRRGGERVNGTITLEEDPRLEIVPVEEANGTPTPGQQRVRDAWLRSKP